MEKTIIRRTYPEALNLGVALHPVLNRIYLSRCIEKPEDLARELADLLPYHDLTDLDKAVSRLYQALIKQEKIVIVGDYDTDGATSTALSVKCLRAFGAGSIDYLVPNRFVDGYGLTPPLVEQAHQLGAALIITVDNGISSHEGVQSASALGIDVIITDHHLPPDTLPQALAIINPNRQGDQFESKCMAGVGVAFYLMLALRRELVATGWFSERRIPQPNMAQYLDLVALGTVADVVALDKNNRILVHHGVRKIAQRKCGPGLSALIEVAKRQQSSITAVDLGFSVAPRLNAAGRLEDMRLGIECLLADSIAEARPMAAQLNQLNTERREIEADMQQQALSAIQQLSLNSQHDLPHGLCLYEAKWHQGVVGIIAGRMKDRYHRPVVAFARVSATELKGSARSIKGVHIRDILEEIERQSPGIMLAFGGHAMAAGLSLHPSNYEKFKRQYTRVMQQRVDAAYLDGKVYSDGELTAADLTLQFAECLKTAGPWGQSFPEPVFDGHFTVLQQYIVGGNHLKLVVGLPGTDMTFDAIAFNVNTELWPNHRCTTVEMAYRLDINEYKQQRKLQLMVEYLQVATTG